MTQNRKILVGAGAIGLVISIIALLVDMGSLGIDIVQGYSPDLISKKGRFFCQLQPDTKKGKEVWTVMYDNDKKISPWLGMVIPMGENWTPLKRCEEIAKRLENFRQDGLMALEYQKDPDTPNQEVICAKTELSGDACPLLLTLDVGVDGYEALRDMTEALRNGTTVYQNTQGMLANSYFSEESPVVYLQPFLAKEDKLAGT